jgi:hypothetical protein
MGQEAGKKMDRCGRFAAGDFHVRQVPLGALQKKSL